jgi:hypothetical protein
LLRQSFILAWILGSAFGGGYGVLLWVGLGSLLEALGFEQTSPVLPFLVGAAFGVPFGIGQWIALRQRFAHAAMWILATSLGFGLVFPLGTLLPQGAAQLSAAKQLVLGLGLGAAVALPPSILQWLFVLRGQVANGGWWIVASSLAWANAFVISFGLGLAFGGLTFIVGPLTAFALTGMAMLRLMKRTQPEGAA